MGVSRQSGGGCSRGWLGAAAGVCLLLAAQTAVAFRGETSAWDAAVMARQIFEAKPQGTHTKAEYSHVMDGFRAIYHGDPSDAHAARAVEQVAELLAEEGHEFHERKSLRDAAGQYEFLAKAYPGGALAPRALGQAVDLLGPDAADDATEAEKVRTQLLNDYPHSAEARAERADEATEARAETPVARASRTPRSAERARRVDEAAAPMAAEDSGRAPAEKVETAETRPGKMAMVTAIRHWSTPTYTRVAIDLGDSVEYQAARVENPDRIFFDLHHTRLAPQLAGKTFAVTDNGFLIRIRAAQFSGDVTRVVLDVHQVAEYSAFLLPNPYRLIIDIHGKSQGAASREQATESASTIQDSAPPPSASKSDGVEVSSLPPMPVTDGSAGFGLPSRDGGGPSSKDVARPRVIIPSKPTEARPVPNSVATRSSDTGVEVAAVSDQPGKVEATRRPTSEPIVDAGTRSKAGRRKSKTHVAGEPAEPPPPTADGEATLMRALGLKIGRIVIDAGHGGHDSGTLGVGGIEEKDVVLDVALRLGKLLHDRLGAEIVYTRADDTFIPLETRTAIANKAQADLFISVHANSSPDPSARGVEVYYLNFTSDPDAMEVASRENAVSTQSVHELSDLVKKIALKDKIDESRELAEDVDQSLYSGLERGNPGLKNRGVKKAPFVVLIGANMPSILAEISFVTNPTDAAELERPEYRQRVAESLYRGIARYAETINGSHKTVPTERAEVSTPGR